MNSDLAKELLILNMNLLLMQRLRLINMIVNNCIINFKLIVAEIDGVAMKVTYAKDSPTSRVKTVRQKKREAGRRPRGGRVSSSRGGRGVIRRGGQAQARGSQRGGRWKKLGIRRHRRAD
jgi:hypothetical protein